MSKILFTDLDGTLLNDEKQITRGNQEAICTALDAGHKIVVTTGRPLVSAKKQAQKLGLTKEGCYCIAYNGALIYDMYEEKILFEQALHKEYARYLFDQAYKMGLHAQTYDENGIVTEADNETLRRYSRLTGVDYRVVDDITTALTRDPEKFLVADFDDHEKLEQYREQVSKWIEGKMDCFFTCDSYLEFVAPGMSKGNAVAYLCDMLKIPMRNSVAAGDAENDISMLTTAGIGAVMKNAGDEMKQYGSYVTKADNNHDGVAEIIYKFILA